jgi:hypothetical protein
LLLDKNIIGGNKYISNDLSNSSDSSVAERCCAKCPKTKMQFFKCMHHDGMHKFTPNYLVGAMKIRDIQDS